MSADRDITRRLVFFTRYPLPGKTKTRLIPRLGADGAADLHRRMAPYILERLLPVTDDPRVELEIRHDLGTERQIRQWLGSFPCRPQTGKDFGDRLFRAMADSAAEGVAKTIIIGADAPHIAARHLFEAFELLTTKDLVLGPAQDGGYYLIGMKSPRRELFEEIEWGTDLVLHQTLSRAAALGLDTALIETLNDIDRPADLKDLPPELLGEAGHHRL